MRYGIVLLGLLSSSSFACPNLSGRYACQDDGQTKTSTITQRMVGSQTEYGFDQMVLTADGVRRLISDDGGASQIYAATTCNDSQVIIHFEITGQSDSGDIITKLSLSSEGSLVQTYQGTWNAVPVAKKVTCKRL